MIENEKEKDRAKPHNSAVKTVTVSLKAIITVTVAIFAALLVIYSAYALYDTFYINRQAFSSTDLQQYKPAIEEIVDEATPLASGLAESNEDYVGWLTIDGTHIDYPVMQGENDLEYASKDIYGQNSISGSIYLATDNHGDFHDLYNVLYGHHMDNGAMFGDIDNYLNIDYLLAHKTGVLITKDAVYDLNIFAVTKTDAYEGMIYTVSEQNEERFAAQKEFIVNNAEYFEEDALKNTKKILAMSTCSSIATNGRIVIFADMTPRFTPVERPEEVEIVEERVPLAPGKQISAGNGSWALINLLSLIFTLYLFLPLFSLKSKFGRKKMMENINEHYNEDAQIDTPKFKRNSWIGIGMEFLLSIAALLLFIFTEDMRQPMVLVDKWTIWMIALYLLVWIVDVMLVRFRLGKGELSANGELSAR